VKLILRKAEEKKGWTNPKERTTKRAGIREKGEARGEARAEESLHRFYGGLKNLKRGGKDLTISY